MRLSDTDLQLLRRVVDREIRIERRQYLKPGYNAIKSQECSSLFARITTLLNIRNSPQVSGD